MAKGPPTSATVFVAAIALTDYNFPTDRGTHSLPAWRMHLRDVTGTSMSSRCHPAAPYELPSEAGMYDAGRAVPSADGRRLTINFIAHHDSTGTLRSRIQQQPASGPDTDRDRAGRHYCVRAGDATPERGVPASGASAIVPAPPNPGSTWHPTLLRWRSRLAAASWSTIVALPTSSVLTDPGIVTRRLAPPFR